jgi:hypothetical protein
VLDMASNESLTYGEHEGSLSRPVRRQLLSPLLVCSTSSVMSSGAPRDAAVEDRSCLASARCSTRSPGNSGNRTDHRGPNGRRVSGGEASRRELLSPLPARIHHRILSAAPLQAAILWCR